MGLISTVMKMLGVFVHGPRFERETKSPLKTQEKFLLNLIRRDKDTVYGKKYHFDSIGSIGEFQRLVPIVRYKDVKPYIERMKKGEPDVLVAEDILLFGITSGTTGSPKYIPTTKTYLKTYLGAAQAWYYYMLRRDHPTMFDGKMVAVATPVTDEKTAAGVPVGSVSGLLEEGQSEMLRRRYAAPSTLLKEVKDFEAKQYLRMRLAVEHNVTFLASANPGYLILLAQKADRFRDEIVRDIRNGTVSEKFDIPEGLREKLGLRLKPNPERARELARIIEEKGHLYPQDYWPNLAVVCSWLGGSMPPFVRKIPRYYGDVPMRDIGLSGTEVRCSTPIKDWEPNGVLALSTTFFEFIPKKDADKDDPETLTVNQVEKGKKYFIVVTNPAGLYRYYLNDVVEVVGFYNKTPVIEFLHKGENMSSVTGEKLSEWQVVHAFEQATKGTGVTTDMFFASGKDGEIPHYEFFVDFHGRVSRKRKLKFLKLVDKALQNYNVEYEKRRLQGRLLDPVLKVLANDSYENFHRNVVKKGAHDAQVKMLSLALDPDFEKQFEIIDEVRMSEGNRVED